MAQTGDELQTEPSLVRCFDYRLIKKLAGEYPVISSECIYLIDGNYLWGLEPFKDGYLISRSDNSPKGKESLKSAQKLFNWIFENTDSKAVYGKIHKDNKPARYIACHAGMKRAFIEEDHIFYKVTKHAKYQAA